MTFLAHIADRVLNRPLLITPAKAEIIAEVLAGRIGIDPNGANPLALADARPEGNRFVGRHGSSHLYRVVNGIGVIPVTGSLVNRGAWIGTSSGLQSYEGIDAQFMEAENDRDVRGILFDLDSPGGEATGMFSLAARIRSARKPTAAVVNDVAASAAYGIAAATKRIFVSPTSITGSIGVVLVHHDRSEEMAKKGIKVSLFYAGKHKVDGHPFGPLSAEVSEDLQKEVMLFYDRFVESVAAGRDGRKTNAEKIRKTESRVYIGEQALSVGLADDVGGFGEALASFDSRSSRSSGRSGGTMSEQDEAARAEAERTRSAAVEDARKAGADAAQKRIAAILGCDEAKGRDALAKHLAFNTSMSIDEAKATLTASPVAAAAEAPKPKQDYSEHREEAGALNLGRPAGDGGKPAAEGNVHSLADRMKSKFPKTA